MRVPADPDPARVKRDLDRLLRASSSWDRRAAEPRPMDFAPSLRLLLLAGAIALLPLGWVWLRQPQADARAPAGWR